MPRNLQVMGGLVIATDHQEVHENVLLGAHAFESYMGRTDTCKVCGGHPGFYVHDLRYRQIGAPVPVWVD